VSEASRLCLRPKSEFMTTQTIENVQIVVDDRERPSGVVAELEKAEGVVVKIEHLSVGDYCVDGAVLIERKTAADFAQSLNIGSQLVRLRNPDYSPYRQAKWKRKKTRQLRILQSLPGVGPDGATQLLERFGTVRACLGASPIELQEQEASPWLERWLPAKPKRSF
jgi:ERCC4-type nuclease